MGYASGKYAIGLCDLCGHRYKLSKLKAIVNNGVATSHKACPSCWSPDHPQNFVHRVRTTDYFALRDPRPETAYAEIRNIHWGWNPVYSVYSTCSLGSVTVDITAPTVTTPTEDSQVSAAVDVSGVESVMYVGDVTTSSSNSAEVEVTGLFATSAIGEAGVSHGASTTVTGLSATSAVGIPLFESVSVAVTGLAATMSLGSVTTSVTRATATSTVTPSTVSAVPTGITSGSTVNLSRGTVYQGMLDLYGLSNVTVQATGTGDMPVVTPGRAVTGWSVHSGNIYKASITGTPTNVMVDMLPVKKSRYPATGWASATVVNQTTVTYTPTNTDIVGARLVYRPYTWAIDQKNVTAYSAGTVTVAAFTDTQNEAYGKYDMPATMDFYLEGKLWMLTQANQWCVEGGFMYVWCPDGASPDGRVWVHDDQIAIKAESTTNCVIKDIKTIGGRHGISGESSTGLTVRNCEMVNPSFRGVSLTSASGAIVSTNVVTRPYYVGIGAWYGSSSNTVSNNTITEIGTYYNTDCTNAGVQSGDSWTIHNNYIGNCGYNSIRSAVSNSIKYNEIDGWCQILVDGGAIYTHHTGDEFTTPLNITIQDNTISGGTFNSSNFAIYIDDYSSYVNVYGNTVNDPNMSIFLHNSKNCDIQSNSFVTTGAAAGVIGFNDDKGTSTVTANTISYNYAQGPNTIPMIHVTCTSGATAANNMATMDNNTYVGGRASDNTFARFETEAVNTTFAEWKTRTGEDANSTFSQT